MIEEIIEAEPDIKSIIVAGKSNRVVLAASAPVATERRAPLCLPANLCHMKITLMEMRP